MIENVLKNFNARVDGKGYMGQVQELVPPKLTIKTDDHRAGGMDAPEEIDMGMEKLMAEMTVSGHVKEMVSLWGLTSGTGVPFVFYGGLQSDDGTVKQAVISITGKVKEIDMGNWKAGDQAPVKYQMNATYYKYTLDGEDLIEIDVPNMVRKINGVDQLAAMRAALGA